MKSRPNIKAKGSYFSKTLYELCTADGTTFNFLACLRKGMFADTDLNGDMPATERIPGVVIKPVLERGVLYTIFNCMFLSCYVCVSE